MLDPAAMPQLLTAFLAAEHPGSRLEVDSYEPVLGGFSRLTGRFRVTVDGDPRWLIARGDPPAEMSTAITDRAQEWRLLQALHRDGRVPVPAPLNFDATGGSLGVIAMVSELVDGDSLLVTTKAANDEQRADLADRLVDLAVTIHGADPALLLPPTPMAWDAYIDARVQQWRDIEARHSESDPFIRYLATWLDENRPPAAPLGLVHGDFQSTNVLVRPDGSFVAIDWELAHVGDPREDLGWCRWNEVIQPPGLMALDEEAFCSRYARGSGLGEDVINPDTVGYFSVLSAIEGCNLALPMLGAFAAGQSSHLATAYVLGYISTFHEQFLEVTTRIESNRKERR